MEVALPYLYLLVVILSIWGVVGFARGVVPEAISLAGIFISWVIVARLGAPFIEQINRLARTLVFVARGGIDAEDPSALVRSVSTVKIVDPVHPEIGLAVLYLAMIAGFFVLSTRFPQGERGVLRKVAGSVLGALNGYLAAYVVFQNPPPKAELVVSIGMPPVRNADSFGPYLSVFLVVAVGLILIVGLVLSLRASRRPGGTQFAERRRG